MSHTKWCRVISLLSVALFDGHAHAQFETVNSVDAIFCTKDKQTDSTQSISISGNVTAVKSRTVADSSHPL